MRRAVQLFRRVQDNEMIAARISGFGEAFKGGRATVKQRLQQSKKAR
jgi:hypothetical protein